MSVHPLIRSYKGSIGHAKREIRRISLIFYFFLIYILFVSTRSLNFRSSTYAYNFV